jgi:TolB protein
MTLKTCRSAFCAVLLSVCAAAHAQLQIDITRGVSDPVPVAVVPFAPAAAGDGGTDVAAIIERDLASSGRFKAIERRAMAAQPQRAADVDGAAWRAVRADYVVVGRVVAAGSENVSLHFGLVNALTGQKMLEDETITVSGKALRKGAHRIADVIFEKITGVRGAFDTRIAYIAVEGVLPDLRYQLIVADADGENAAVAARGSQPLMSLAWSPDGEWLAYVSFETGVSTVNVQRVRTGELRKVSARNGVNGAPTYSPDGKQLALTLGGSGGNLDIYVLDLATQNLRRITEDPAIDTQPAWSPDGKSLYFMSDRGGAPQIYSVDDKAGAPAHRVSFGVVYAARPRVSPDGKLLALEVQEGSAFHIATLDLASGNITSLSRGALDESPSFAPNGAMLIYAGRERGQGVLATVSVDGQVTARLQSSQGDVREPVWGPFTN